MKNNLVHITWHFFKALNYSSITKLAVERLLKNHPLQSTLLSISDTLKEKGIENYIINQSKNTNINLEHYPIPFIAQLDSNDNEFVIVKKYSSKEKTLDIHSIFEGKQSMKEVDFLKNWKHVALLASPETNSKTNKIEKHQKQELLFQVKQILSYFSIAFLVSGILFLAFHFTNIIFTGFIFSKLFGLALCLFIYRYEFLNKGEEMMQSICSVGGISSNDCSQLITAKKINFFGLASWSELGLLYFSGSTLAFLFTFQNYETALPLFGALNLLCLLFIPYSLYFQKVIVKKWCTLCLGILLIFAVESLLLYKISFPIGSFSLVKILLFILAFSIPFIIYFFLGAYIKNTPEHKQKSTELNYLKFQSGAFHLLSAQSEQLDRSNIINPITLKEANENKKNTLLIALNPFCPPCKEEFFLLGTLLDGFYPNLEVQILIASNKNKSSKDYQVGFMLYCIYKEKGKQAFRKAMTEWYNNNKKETWSFQFSEGTERYSQYEKEFKEHLDLLSTFIRFTPSVFFNESALPPPYSIADIKYLMD